MEIPIQNIYYLLCYSWDKLEEKDIVDVDKIESPEILDLLCKVLTGGTAHLLKRGLDRSYVGYQEDTRNIRGKINFNESVKRNLIRSAMLNCEFDELDYNILHNQIIKATFRELLRNKSIDPKIREEMKNVYRFFTFVDDISLSDKVFVSVKINRNNSFYDFLLKICKLIYDNLLINENEGESKFKNFLQDEVKMRYLFEDFVRNFYKREQQVYKARIEDIKWNAKSLNEVSDGFLPRMRTDISLESSRKKIIIDTKYYKDIFQRNRETEKIHSGNLYQLFSYLKNIEVNGGVDEKCEGVLLYPTTTEEFNLSYNISGHKISVRTINLKQDWKDIHNNLLELIAV